MRPRALTKLLISLPKNIAAQTMTASVRAGLPWGAGLLHRLERRLSSKGLSQRFLAFESVASAAGRLSLESKVVLPARNIEIGPLRRIGRAARVDAIEGRRHRVSLPEVRVTIFRDVKVIGGSEMLWAGSESIVYDELAKGDPNRYGGKSHGIIPAQSFGGRLPTCHAGRVVVRYYPNDGAHLPRAIHLCKDHSTNYFHWLLECLPRAIAALEDPRFDGYPLLVDAGLPDQCLEALNTVSGLREIVPVEPRATLHVGELVFTDPLSVTHDNYGFAVSANDFVIAPEAVRMLRDRLLPKAGAVGGRRLYVARPGAAYRRLLNEVQIQERVHAEGFEIVRPETLSFAQQVELFSGASAIVGPTGAGLTNTVFAPPACKVIVLAGETRRANHFVFGQLADRLDIEMIYVTGAAMRPGQLHSDYRIDPSDFDEALAQMGLRSK